VIAQAQQQFNHLTVAPEEVVLHHLPLERP
jgi:hypothetical protein